MSPKLTHLQGRTFAFSEPLFRGRIVDRPNRFVMRVEVEGRLTRCYTPVTGRIGGLTLDGLPCLLSRPKQVGTRTTDYTVEAIGLEEETSPTFQWVGINQTEANTYVHEALKAGLLAPALPAGVIARERALQGSRIDFFLYEKLFLEVKMPLIELSVAHLASLPHRTFKPGPPSGRLLTQLEDLTSALKRGQGAGQLTLFAHENTGPLTPEEQLSKNIGPSPQMEAARAAGLQRWRLQVKISPEGLTVGELQEVPHE